MAFNLSLHCKCLINCAFVTYVTLNKAGCTCHLGWRMTVLDIILIGAGASTPTGLRPCLWECLKDSRHFSISEFLQSALKVHSLTANVSLAEGDNSWSREPLGIDR